MTSLRHAALLLPLILTAACTVSVIDSRAPVSEPSPLPSPSSSSAPSEQNPNLGVNLGGLNDWARSMMFTDFMRTSRKWGSASAPWDGSAATDANGWPTQDAGVVVAADVGPSGSETNVSYLKTGVYKLSFTGRANVRATGANVSLSNSVYNPVSNTSTADITVGTNTANLFLYFTGTTGGVKNVVLMRPGYAGTGKIFTDEYLAVIAPFSTLRFMDYLMTNNNPLRSWSERPTRSAASYASPKGGAYEDLIALANLTGKDIWINIPVRADDDFVFQLATLLKTQLLPGIHVYVEYSNELWNDIFSQTQENSHLAVAEAAAGDTSLQGQNPYWAGWLRVGKRTVQISRIFAQVFGQSAINTTIRPILATQFAYKAIGEQQLKYINTYFGPPKNFLYAIAGAPYVYLGSLPSTATAGDILASLQRDFTNHWSPMFRAGTPYNGGDWTGATQLALAKYYGIKSFAYEGSTDASTSNVNAGTMFQAMNDPAMGDFVKSYIGQWLGCGNDLFMWFVDVGAYDGGGFWGLTNDPLNLNTPQYKAYQEMATTAPSSFTTCR